METQRSFQRIWWSTKINAIKMPSSFTHGKPIRRVLPQYKHQKVTALELVEDQVSGAYGGSVGLSGGYTYSRCKTHQQNKGQGESESSTVEVRVRKGETIIIKEKLVEVEERANCSLELVLEDGQKLNEHVILFGILFDLRHSKFSKVTL